MSKLMGKLAVVETMTAAQLKEEWVRVHGAPAPSLSPDLLRRGLAHRLQERAHGGLCRRARSIITRIADAGTSKKPAPAPARKLSPGTRLVRDWHGVGHTVTVLDDGFDYDERRWTSLTAIARSITGAKWSGPRFFGLNAAGGCNG